MKRRNDENRFRGNVYEYILAYLVYIETVHVRRNHYRSDYFADTDLSGSET
jgi:hypothetical protein